MSPIMETAVMRLSISTAWFDVHELTSPEKGYNGIIYDPQR